MDIISSVLIPALAIMVVVITLIRRWSESAVSPFREVCGEHLLPGEEVSALQDRLDRNPNSERAWLILLEEIRVFLPLVKARVDALEAIHEEHGLDDDSLAEIAAGKIAVHRAETLLQAPEQALAAWREHRDINLLA